MFSILARSTATIHRAGAFDRLGEQLIMRASTGMRAAAQAQTKYPDPRSRALSLRRRAGIGRELPQTQP
jgi:hypothetical protein